MNLIQKKDISMDLAPVLLFVYNRPEHTKRQLSQYSKVSLAKEPLKVKNNGVPYERYSVLLHDTECSWPLLAGLQKVTIENDNRLPTIDFGGYLGSTYYQNRHFIGNAVELDWHVVE